MALSGSGDVRHVGDADQLTWSSTVARMTIDAMTRRRMPGAVLTAVILLGCFGSVGGVILLAMGAVGLLSAGAFYGDAALPLMLVGALVLTMTVLGATGLVKGNRGAQIVAVSLGAMLFLAGVFGLSANLVGGVFVMAGGGALVLLVLAPVSSREWFSN